MKVHDPKDNSCSRSLKRKLLTIEDVKDPTQKEEGTHDGIMNMRMIEANMVKTKGERTQMNGKIEGRL
ncbi:hypothetical protein HanIR_Chr09g0438241 [Helianthus annuus]|nr:hypothetical protein HanIR_Chr09g0438241 [Helianthus annuus]